MCVTGFDPLRLYLYREGLARFATEPYSASARSLRRKRMHITNYSVQSASDDFVHNQARAFSSCSAKRSYGEQRVTRAAAAAQAADDDDVGSKWSLSALRRRLEADGVDWPALWRRLCDVVVKARPPATRAPGVGPRRA